VAALGFVGAFLSGLVGVGGAVVMIPLLYYVPPILGVGTLDAKQVAGVTMAQVLVAALLGAWTHGRRNLVHRSLAFRGGTAMAAGSLLGSLGSHFAGGRVLLAVFAVMATLALPLMFLSPADLGELAEPSRVTVSPAQAVAYPAIVGFLAGFVGAGGAFVLLPVLIGLMRVPVRVSIATSLVMTAASAAAGFVGKAATGQIPLAPAAMVVVGSLAGAPLGASVSRLVPVELLRGVLAVLVGLAALRVWADVLTP
jgi:hypothetical protein